MTLWNCARNPRVCTGNAARLLSGRIVIEPASTTSKNCCAASPPRTYAEQHEGYLRSRHEYFIVQRPDAGGELVYLAGPEGHDTLLPEKSEGGSREDDKGVAGRHSGFE